MEDDDEIVCLSAEPVVRAPYRSEGQSENSRSSNIHNRSRYWQTPWGGEEEEVRNPNVNRNSQESSESPLMPSLVNKRPRYEEGSPGNEQTIGSTGRQTDLESGSYRRRRTPEPKDFPRESLSYFNRPRIHHQAPSRSRFPPSYYGSGAGFSQRMPAEPQTVSSNVEPMEDGTMLRNPLFRMKSGTSHSADNRNRNRNRSPSMLESVCHNVDYAEFSSGRDNSVRSTTAQSFLCSSIYSEDTPRRAVSPKNSQLPPHRAVSPKNSQPSPHRAVSPKNSQLPPRRAVTPKNSNSQPSPEVIELVDSDDEIEVLPTTVHPVKSSKTASFTDEINKGDERSEGCGVSDCFNASATDRNKSIVQERNKEENEVTRVEVEVPIHTMKIQPSHENVSVAVQTETIESSSSGESTSSAEVEDDSGSDDEVSTLESSPMGMDENDSSPVTVLEEPFTNCETIEESSVERDESGAVDTCTKNIQKEGDESVEIFEVSSEEETVPKNSVETVPAPKLEKQDGLLNVLPESHVKGDESGTIDTCTEDIQKEGVESVEVFEVRSEEQTVPTDSAEKAVSLLEPTEQDMLSEETNALEGDSEKEFCSAGDTETAKESVIESEVDDDKKLGVETPEDNRKDQRASVKNQTPERRASLESISSASVEFEMTEAKEPSLNNNDDDEPLSPPSKLESLGTNESCQNQPSSAAIDVSMTTSVSTQEVSLEPQVDDRSDEPGQQKEADIAIHSETIMPPIETSVPTPPCQTNVDSQGPAASSELKSVSRKRYVKIKAKVAKSSQGFHLQFKSSASPYLSHSAIVNRINATFLGMTDIQEGNEVVFKIRTTVPSNVSSHSEDSQAYSPDSVPPELPDENDAVKAGNAHVNSSVVPYEMPTSHEPVADRIMEQTSEDANITSGLPQSVTDDTLSGDKAASVTFAEVERDSVNAELGITGIERDDTHESAKKISEIPSKALYADECSTVDRHEEGVSDAATDMNKTANQESIFVINHPVAKKLPPLERFSTGITPASFESKMNEEFRGTYKKIKEVLKKKKPSKIAPSPAIVSFAPKQH